VQAKGGFSNTVNLSVGGLPESAVPSFTPGTITGSGDSDLIISTSSATPPGDYSLDGNRTNAPNSKIKEVIDQAKQKYPELKKKPEQDPQ